MGQLPLALQLNRSATFASFVGGENAAAVAHVHAIATGQRGESVWLAGPRSAGKTHLLTAACRAAHESGLRPMYLALDSAGDPAVLTDLDQIDLLALDGMDRIAGNSAWESALFPLLNASLQRGGLLMAARSIPRECAFALADLASRVAAAAVYMLAPLSDDELGQALNNHAQMRGLNLDAAAIHFLLSRLSRDPAELVNWIDRIDRVALAEQRRITVPWLRQLIARAANDE